VVILNRYIGQVGNGYPQDIVVPGIRNREIGHDRLFGIRDQPAVLDLLIAAIGAEPLQEAIEPLAQFGPVTAKADAQGVGEKALVEYPQLRMGPDKGLGTDGIEQARVHLAGLEGYHLVRRAVEGGHPGLGKGLLDIGGKDGAQDDTDTPLGLGQIAQGGPAPVLARRPTGLARPAARRLR
jgi:hypothetical protein